ncbi:MAG: DUF1269 domain-containing protein [Anaerolineae bacterium]
MADVIAIVYPDEKRAGEVIESMQALQADHGATFGSGRAVVKDAQGKVTLQSAGFRAASKGRWWHKFIGGVVTPGFTEYQGWAPENATFDEETADYSLSESFIKDLAKEMQPGSSAVFLVVLQGNTAALHKRLADFGGTLLYSNLGDAAAAELEAELEEEEHGASGS